MDASTLALALRYFFPDDNELFNSGTKPLGDECDKWWEPLLPYILAWFTVDDGDAYFAKSNIIHHACQCYGINFMKNSHIYDV